MSTRIISLDDAQEFKGCVLGYGHFTTIHPGHIRYLRHAKVQGEKLVIALKGDGLKNNSQRYQFNQKERAEALSLLNIADAVILLDENELVTVVDNFEPNILILGKEFEHSPEPEMKESIEILKSKNLTVMFHGGDIHYSTADLLSTPERELKKKRQYQFKVACRRQGLHLDSIISSMNKWKSTKLIVLGDTIIDQYAACEAVGMSAEAPVVVVRELKRRNFIGGAAIVASHIRNLGAQCKFISVVGDDATSEIVRNSLVEQDIEDGLVFDKTRPTTFKKRYVVDNQKLFRVTRLEDHNLDSDVEDQVIKQLEESAKTAKGIVVSDFVYGVITDRVLDAIQNLSRKYGLMLFGDLQCSSQIGSVTKFRGFSLLCPNEREARIALQAKEE